jgi:lipopolysaccharide biosynthesis protein
MDTLDSSHFTNNSKVRLIAFYLPQYHPIPENDAWWGKGFTEWTNVTKARPLFCGHYQPHVPADLGFYDLRLPEVRVAQAELAREHGIGGFCYWHYWFGGKRLLERPFTEVLRSGEPKFPFCLGWANESWTGAWHGAPDKILLEQTYPGPLDEERHFHTVAEAFFDDRYMTIDGKPIFYVYKPQQIPEPQRFVEHWQNLAIKAGLTGIYFIGEDVYMDDNPWNPGQSGFDAVVPNSPGVAILRLSRRNTLRCMSLRILSRFFGYPNIYDYNDFVAACHVDVANAYDFFPNVLVTWDNTPRAGASGNVLINASPELFRKQLCRAVSQVADRPPDKRIVFIKSWNEWAEGNHLEPDLRDGRAYLEICRDELVGRQ